MKNKQAWAGIISGSIGLSVVILLLLAGCSAEDRDELRQAQEVAAAACTGKVSAYVEYQGARGWTGDYLYTERGGSVNFYPEGMQGSESNFRIRYVPCRLLRPAVSPQPGVE